MGIEVKRNKKTGQYRLTSTISDERLHEKPWVSLDEAKAALVNRAFWDFIYKVCEIDIDFPSKWRVNDEAPEKWGGDYNRWWLDNYSNPHLFKDRFNEVIKRTGVDIDTTKPLE